MEREVYSEEQLTVSVEIEAGKVKLVDASADSGFGVRVAKDSKMGFGFAKTQEKAEELAKKSMVRKFYGFPAPGKTGKEVFHEVPTDPRILVERVKEMAKQMEAATAVRAFSAVVTRKLQNSNGLDVEEKQSWLGYSAYTASGGSEGWESWEGRKDEKNKWVDVATKAQSWAKKWQGASKFEHKTLPIVLSARAASSLLGQMLLPNLSAERAIYDQTILKLGEGEGSVKVVSTPSLHMTAFDGEGLAPQEFTVFDGNLKSYLHTFSTAKEMKAEPTANAGRDWKSFPTPSPVDLSVITNKAELGGEYILVNDLSGVHTANPTAGRFSVEAHQSFLMPDESPLQPFIISGTLEDLLKAQGVGTVEQRGVFNLPALRVKLVC
ncbi:MAG: hypothetical protein GOV00_03535 [Candidatus Altiarchaeota archaeon]|nr:hypothetical protein [Candidatus Altiarchaeota archaeon]